MKRIIAAITTMVIAAGIAVTGVSIANADVAVGPSTVVTTTDTAPDPNASPKPTPMASPSTAPNPAPALFAHATAPSPVKSPSPTPSASPTPSEEKCLPASAVSYSYDPTKNSGIVLVAARPDFSVVLCDALYITAASWKYTMAAVWPQSLDSSATNYLTVAKVGTYAFGAAVTCGQGDIYARTGSYIVPTPQLQGPQNWEKFLSGLRLQTTSPGSSYMQSPLSCVRVAPVASIVASQCHWNAEQGDSFKLITIEYDSRKSNVPVDFSVQGDPAQHVDYSVYNRTVPGGELIAIKPPASSTSGASYTVLTAGARITLDVPAYEACPPEIPTLPLADPAGVSFADTCGVQGDKVTIPAITTEEHFRYSTADAEVSGARTVTVAAIPDAGYGFSSHAVKSWSHTFKTDAQNHCVKVPGDPEVVNQTCSVSSEGVVSGYLTVVAVTGVVYTIHPLTPGRADIIVTGSKANVVPGDYLVMAAAEPGFILSGVTQWKRTVANNAVDCSLPTHAFLPSSVNWVSQICSTSGPVSGYISIDPTDFLNYFVGTAQLTSARTVFAPGTYTVTVTAPPGDTIDGPSSYTAIITKATTSCGNLGPQSLTTLAFTGFDSGAGYLAVASALLLLGAALVFGARRAAKS